MHFEDERAVAFFQLAVHYAAIQHYDAFLLGFFDQNTMKRVFSYETYDFTPLNGFVQAE